MDEATCYVFKSKRDRPVKRRRLNDENENVERARRQKLFEREWAVQDARLLVCGAYEVFWQRADGIRKRSTAPTGPY